MQDMQEKIVGYRLSPQQERLWLLQRDQRSSPYRARCVILIEGALDRSLLKRAIEDISNRHEILRTGFRSLPGVDIPLQVVADEADISIQELDISHLSPEEQESEIQALYQGLGQIRLSLEQTRPLHVQLLVLSEQKHSLLMALPSMCADSVGLKNLVRLVVRCYSARKMAVGLPLPSLQYADVSEWQNELLETEEAVEAAELLSKYNLADCSKHSLPFGKQAKPDSAFDPKSHALIIDSQLREEIKVIARNCDSTIDQLLLACWATLIWRHTSRSELIIGYAVDGRSYEELEEEIGPLSKYLPLDLRLEDDHRLLGLLKQLRDRLDKVSILQEFFAWQQVAGPKYDGSEMPFYPLCFDFKGPVATLLAPDVSFSIRKQSACIDRYAIELFCSDDRDGLSIEFHYDSNLFSREDILRLSAQFQRLLASISSQPEAAIINHETLSDDERQQLLVRFNATTKDYPRVCLHQLFELQAERTPDRVAIDCGQQQMTYAELNSRANQLANQLHTLGVGPESLVGICIKRSVKMVVGVLGVLKAGGAYVPIDPLYPAERQGYILGDSLSQVMLAETGIASSLPIERAKVIYLGSDWSQFNQHSQENLICTTSPDNLAYVIYTSGSTGNPKGVMVTHRGLANYLTWAVRAYDVEDGEGAPVHSPLSFDLTVTSLFAPLLTGKRVLLLPDDNDIEALSTALRNESKFSLVKITPSHLHILCCLLAAEEAAGRVRTLVIGGEALRGEDISFWHRHAPGTRIINEYGPTETVVGCCVYETLSGVETQGSVPIGRPIANTQIYLLDSGMRPVPAGVTGELFISGEGVARGYLNRPDLTAEKFIPNPFSDVPGERLYKTGDLARFLTDGNLEYLGRNDHQVKIRGFRIELGEIEASLRLYPGVSNAVAVLREQDSGGKQIVAYVTTQSKTSTSPVDLLLFLEQKLPKYMVPTAIVLLESLPLTPNGKLDSSALPPPSTDNTLMPASAPPSTATQQTLARIFCSVLGLESVGIDDNFFSLGGDSILCIKVVGKANRAGIKLTPRLVFQHPTISELARVAQPLSARAPEEQAGEGPSPLTPIQRWLFAQRLAQVDQFNQGVVLKLPQGMRTAQVAAAMATLIERHDALRLRFEETALGWQARVTAPGQWQSITEVDLGCLRGRARREAFERVSEELQRELSINRGPVVVAGVIRLGASQRGRLVIVIHHLCVDAVSWRVMVEELEEVLRQQELGQRAQLGEKTAGYREWAEAVEEWGGGEPARRQAQYWERELVRVKGSGAIPVDNEGGKNRERDVGRERERLSREQSERVKKEVREVTGARVQEVMLWAVGKAISRWSGRREVVVDVEGHGRQEIGEGVDVSRSVGWFTTIYPVVIEVEQGSGWQEEVREVSRQARLGTEAGLGYMMMKYGGEQQEQEQRRGGGREVAEVLFNYLGKNERRADEEGVLELSRQEVVGVRGGANERSHLIEINSQEVGGRLEVEWSYSRGVHRASSIEEVVRWWKEAIEEAVEGSKEVMREIEGRSGEEVEEVYELTPMQEGLLFETLYEQETGAYYVQTRIRVRGEIKYEEMRRAWEGVVRKHKVLRSGFEWEGMERGVQVVRRGVEVEVEEEDWRGGSREEQEERMREMMREDKERGVDVRRPPLMRVKVIREGEREYEIVWSSHHLILDGWSAGIVLKEVMEMYEMYEREDRGEGEEEEEEERMSYREYVERVRSKDKDEAERYWRRRLRGNRGKTEMKVRRGRGEGYGSAEWRMSEEESRGMERAGKEIGVTVSTMVQGGWVIVLSRYSGEEEVMYGMTVSGRGGEGEEGVVGLCINTMPVRVRSKGEERVRERMRRIQEEQVEQREYEYVGLVEVQRWGEEEGEGGKGEGLFDSLIVFENYPIDKSLIELQRDGQKLQVISAEVIERTHYPLTLAITPGSEFSICVTYNRKLFDDDVVTQIIGHFQNACRSITANIDGRVSDLSILTEAEQQQLLVSFNDTQVNHPKNVCLHQLIETQVERTPRATAVIFESEQLSYNDLNRRANQLAHYLMSSGGGPEKIVGICMERSLEMVIALLGSLKAGVIYVPIDPSYPKERIDYIINDTAASIILTQGHLAEHLLTDHTSMICLDTDWDLIASHSSANLTGDISPDNLAYILYTSGSTGSPKGSMVIGRALCNHMLWMQRVYPLSGADRVLQRTQFGFDASVWEFYAPLIAGGCVVMARPGVQHDSGYLISTIIDHRVSIIQCVPTLLRILLAERDFKSCACLRRVFCGGEPLTRELCDSFFAQLDADLINLYGPTETTIEVLSCLIDANAGDEDVPIGRPIDNTQAYILSADLRPVPMGVAGELYIGGEALGRGYYNRPDLTAEKFIPNPFSQYPGARLYKTGDLARYSFDGSVYFLGRVDYMVKVRGHRIELEEIERTLERNPGVRQAAVIVRDDLGDEKILVAYAVPEPGSALSAAELRGLLREQLPEYMVPTYFVILDALPLMPNGKVDRRNLPRPEVGRAQSTATYELPRNETERAIASVWKEILHLDKVGIHDNFFDLGGTSVHLIYVQSRLKERIGSDPGIITLFNYSTIDSLAAHLSGERAKQPTFSRAIDRVRKREEIRVHDQARTRREAVDRQKQLVKSRKNR